MPCLTVFVSISMRAVSCKFPALPKHILTNFPLPGDGIGDVAIRIQLPHCFKSRCTLCQHLGRGSWDHPFRLRRLVIRHRKQLQAAIGADFDIGFQGVHAASVGDSTEIVQPTMGTADNTLIPIQPLTSALNQRLISGSKRLECPQ